MSTILRKATFSTKFNADSVEWCPVENFSNLLVCGTYELLQTKIKEKFSSVSRKRIGCLYLLNFSSRFHELLSVLQEILMPGILDCKWCHVRLQNVIYLAIVNAEGELRIFELSEDEVYLKEVHNIKLTSDNESLLLSLDWSTGITSNSTKIVISSSTGHIFMVSFQGKSIFQQESWKLHGFEAWIVAFNYWDVNTFFSGGDDCKLKFFDIRSGQVVSANGVHNAGVTSMHMSTKTEYELISGSYDEYIFFWDIRMMKEQKNEIRAGGGVWRLKWEPKVCTMICAPCMYSGSIIVDSANLTIIAEYKEHVSINYGMDWSSMPEERICNELNIAKKDNCLYNIVSVCSFYDKLLSLALLETYK